MIVGLDVGGSTIHAAASLDGTALVAEATRPTPSGPGAILAAMRAVVDGLVAQAGAPLEAIGVGIPGAVDPDTGIVDHAVNLGVAGPWPLGERLAQIYGVPVAVDNDVKTTARGAFSHMAREGEQNLAYVNVGTGVACASIAQGRLVRGFANMAGEIGHIPIDPDGAPCPCGQRGCLETVIGGRAIVERLVAAGMEPDIGAIFAERAAPWLGEERARILEGMARAVELVALCYGADRVVLGGGVVTRIPDLVDRLSASLEAHAAASGLLATLGLSSRVALAGPELNLPVRGAVAIAATARESGISQEGT